MDYYAVLGITKSSSPEEIKQAYRKLAMKHHPDKGGDEAEFKKINEAYAVLGNKTLGLYFSTSKSRAAISKLDSARMGRA